MQENRVPRKPSGKVFKEKQSLHILWMIAVRRRKLKKELQKIKTMVMVATSSTTKKLIAMEVAMGTMVTLVTRILESCLVGTKTTHGDLKELDVAKGASGTVDLGVEVSTIDQGNDKETKALGALDQLQSRDDSEIARLWAKGDGNIGANLPLLMYLSKKQEKEGQGVDGDIANSGEWHGAFGSGGLASHLSSASH